MKQIKTLAVGGTIGVGKSTFCEKLWKNYNCTITREIPKDKNHVIHKFLEAMYNDRLHHLTTKDYAAFAFQSYMIGYRMTELMKEDKNHLRVFDRTILEDVIFAEELIGNTHLLDGYFEMWDHAMRQLEDAEALPDMYLILKPQFRGQTLQNIIKRNRKCEIDNLRHNIDYFQKLEDKYVKKLCEMCDGYNIPYKVIEFGSEEHQTGIIKELEEWLYESKENC